MKNIVIFTILLVVSFALQPLSADAQRANFDSDRMERDLRIMERIYTDLQYQVRGATGATTANLVNASYFPGYGVVFNINETFSNVYIRGTVPGTSTTQEAFFQGQNQRSEAEERFFAGSTQSARVDSASQPLRLRISGYTTPAVEVPSTRNIHDLNKTIIRDFFTNYVDAIGQLQDSDRIAVLISNRGNPISYSVIGANSRLQTASYNPLRAEVLVGDVVAYRTGRINSEAFGSRIVFSEMDTSSPDHKELQVMRGIFDAALRNNKVSKFSSSRSTHGVLMTNFGAMFSIDVMIEREVLVGAFNPSSISSVEILKNDDGGETIIMLKDSTRIVLPSSVRERQVSGVATVTSTGSRIPQGVVTMAERPSDIRAQTIEGEYVSFRESMDKLIEQVSELMLDYGRTLRSLKADDKVLVTINQNTTRNDPEVPNRVEIQVDVKTLRDFDRGAMSRDEAMKKLAVRRY
jgi:hypothetical protein